MNTKIAELYVEREKNQKARDHIQQLERNNSGTK